MQQHDPEFLKAFAGEDVTDQGQGNEVPDEVAEGNTDDAAASMVIDPKTAVANAASEAGLPVEQEAGAAGEVGGAPEMSPEDIQRLKSWEGRLRKREEELAAQKAAMGNAPAALADVGGVDDAEIEAARQELSGDFGDRFVDLIIKIAAHEARKLAASSIDEKLSPVQQTVEQAIRDVHEAFQNMHFSAIADAHENFEQVISSPEFAAYINGLSGDEQAAAQSVLQDGSPKQVIALLTAYKDSLNQKTERDNDDEDAALDAAEGVRGSAPVQLPQRAPSSADDEYKAAWDSM